MDAPALAGAQEDLVDAEGGDAERASQREEALVGVGIELRVADAGLHGSDHAWKPIQVSDSSGVRPPWWPLKRRSGLGTAVRPTIRPGAGSTQTSASRSRRRGPMCGKSSAASRTSARCSSRARQLRDDRLGIVDVQEEVARGAGGRAREVPRQLRPEEVQVVGGVDVELAVVGGHQQRRVDARQRVERAQRGGDERVARRTLAVAGGVDLVPVEVASARGAPPAARRPPRSSRTARRSRPRTRPSRTACPRSARAAARSRPRSGSATGTAARA